MLVVIVLFVILIDLLVFFIYWLNKICFGFCKEICILDDYLKLESVMYMCLLFVVCVYRGDLVV